MNRRHRMDPKVIRSNDGGAILIISLWVILILSVIALSLGMRGALEAKIARFYYDRASERALARAGIDVARFIIESDKDAHVDSCNDTWYNPESIQRVLDVNALERLILTIRDEESRININIAPEKVLRGIFEYCSESGGFGSGDIEDLVADALYFRGDSALRGESSLGKDYVGRPFWNNEDMLLLEHIKLSDFEALQGLITVFPYTNDNLKVNINTANAEIIDILLAAAVSDDSTREMLSAAIRAYCASADDSGKNHYFRKSHLSAYALLDELGLTRDVKVVSLAVQLLRNVTVDSQYFSVTAEIIDSKHKVYAVLGPQQATTSTNLPGETDTSLAVLSWREL